MDFIASYFVDQPIVSPPIIAKPGEILAVWPAHPTRTITICDNRPGYPVLRWYTVSMGALYGMVLIWEADEAIRPVTPSSSLAGRLALLTAPRSLRLA